MANTVLIKRSGTPSSIPTAGQLLPGELAINYADGNLFYKNASNVVTVIASNQFVSVAGNVIGNYFIGNGSQLTGITVAAGTAIVNGNSNVTVGANGNITVSVAGTANVTVFTPTGQSITGTVSATGNVTGAYIIGNGSALTSLTGSDVVGNVGNAVHAYFADVANSVSGSNVSGQVANALVAGTVYTNAQPNITSVGTLTSVSVVGNVTGGNLITAALVQGATVSASGNVIGGNVVTAGAMSAGSVSTAGNINGANVIAVAAVSAASVSASGNITAGNLNAAGLSLSSNVVSALNSTANITTTANISAGFFLGNGSQLTGVSVTKISNGTSEANIGTANGNANISIAGTSNVAVFTTGGLNITGAVSATSNVTGLNTIAYGGFNFTPRTLGANTSTPTGYNALALGPFTVPNGLVLTVSDNSAVQFV